MSAIDAVSNIILRVIGISYLFFMAFGIITGLVLFAYLWSDLFIKILFKIKDKFKNDRH